MTSNYMGDQADLANVMGDTEECPLCRPLACDDPDRHMGHTIPAEYTPLKNRGCHCGADFDGRDCMCFEDYGD